MASLPTATSGMTILPAAGTAASLRDAQEGALGAPATGSATGVASADKSKAIAKTAQDFEAVFLGEFLSSMFTTQQKGLFAPGHAGEIYRSLLTQEYGKAFAKAGGVGIAKEVQREMLKLQEVQKR